MDATEKKSPQATEFARRGTMKRRSFFSDYLFMLKHNKKWWMLPLILIMLAFGVLMVLSSTGISPFIYTIF